MSLNHASRTILMRYAVRSIAVVYRSLPSAHLFIEPFNNGVTRPFSDRIGIFDRMKGSLEDRNKRKEREKYAEQLEKMANSETWTLGNFMNELQESVPSGWRSKIPGVGNTQQAKTAKETQRAVQGILDEVGEDATVGDLEKMNRKEKLKMSLKTQVSVQELNMLIEQFKGMQIMHQILRKQKLDGKPIPKDEQGMKALFQTESTRVMTKSQRKSIMKSRMKRGGGVGRM